VAGKEHVLRFSYDYYIFLCYREDQLQNNFVITATAHCTYLLCLYITIESTTESDIEKKTSINIFTLLHMLLLTYILFLIFQTRLSAIL